MSAMSDWFMRVCYVRLFFWDGMGLDTNEAS